jgi:signal transduction histidine kinase/ActR/RegA family two-component response regulator
VNQSANDHEQRWLEGSGEAGALVRSIDWSKTPLGPIATWPTPLKTLVATLLHAQHPMLLWWGPELRQFYNDSFIPSLGSKHPTAMGQRGDECWQEVWPVVGKQIEDVITHGKSIKAEDQLIPILRNGRMEDVYWSYSYSPVYDESESVVGMLVVCTDTTARVLGEKRRDEVDRANAALEKVQREREGLLVEAQQASRAKDEFFAMLGHELRNPLAPIVMALHLMKQHTTDTVRREQEIIERQVSHLVRLVDDLLDVSKIARGKVTLRKEIVELRVVVAAAIEIVSDLFEEHRHQISVNVPQSGLSVFGDPVRLAQVVANLLSNAARYTEPNGEISISGSREDNEVVLIVKDNGVGIGADLLPRVFDLFVQGRRNTDRKEGGLGLGLALVKSLALMHDGKVSARSDGAERGSEFEIRLPAREKKAFHASVSDSKEAANRVSSKRILVVDDNADSAEMMRVILESAGHQVEVANDGPGALSVVEGFSPEIALLDIGLPVMDGYELGKRLHATTNAASCRLIALTGYGQAHDRAQSKASGFEAHFVKPVDTRHLLELIASDVP